MIVLVVSNVGFFYRGFTPEVCEHFHLVAPSFKGTGSMAPCALSALLADQSDSDPINGVAGNPGYPASPGYITLISSLTLSSSTYNISQRRPWVGRVLLSMYIIAILVRFLSSEAMFLVLIVRHSSNGFRVFFLGCVSQENISTDITVLIFVSFSYID